MHRYMWTTCGLWSLMLLFFVHNERCLAADFQLHYPPLQPASGFINRSVSTAELAGTITFAEDLVSKGKRLESSIAQSRIRLARDSTSFALLLDSLPDEHSKQLDRQAQIVLKASVQLLNKYCLGRNGHTEADCARDIETVPLPEFSTASEACVTANDSNGVEPSTYRRLLPAAYSDGLQRMSHAHSQPLPKTISDSLYTAATSSGSSSSSSSSTNIRQNGGNEADDEGDADDDGTLDLVRNIAVMQWAQFVEHDLAKTVFRTMDDGLPIECCDVDFRAAAPRYRHPACAPLLVESKGNHISCLNYVRSALGLSSACNFGAAQQHNQATSQLDLSQVYGPSEPIASSLRRFVDGELSTGQSHRADAVAAETLPEAPLSANLCMNQQRSSRVTNDTNATSADDHRTDTATACYLSGDSRCNANPLVTPLYTLQLRAHNALARSLRRRKVHWSDERVFRRARRINTAVYKSIVFGEWLPIVVGAQMAEQINGAQRNAKVTDAAGISNEWATAAARFYYSMMPGELKLDEEDAWSTNAITPQAVLSDVFVNRTKTTIDLQQEWYRPRDLGRDQMLDRVLAATLKQRAQAMDAFYVNDVSQYLFRTSASAEIGTDALALDIQRGRDHGLSGYTAYVELCTGQPRPTDWQALRPLMSMPNIERLRSIYRHPHQIDLIVGGVAETPMAGATVGPTFACLFGEQLARTRRNVDAEQATVDEQFVPMLAASGYGGAHFLCEHTGLTAVPRNIFHVASEVNPLVECSTLSKLCDVLGIC